MKLHSSFEDYSGSITEEISGSYFVILQSLGEDTDNGKFEKSETRIEFLKRIEK